MLDDSEMVNYLQKLLGYSITGSVREQKFVVLWGLGANGKGCLQNVLSKLLGNYYRQVTNDIIIEKGKSQSGAASPHIMQLFNTRVAFVDESDSGDKLNEGVVKNITGGSKITARPLYGDIIEFNPTHHIFLLTNHKPEISSSKSLKRRLILIPFIAEFMDEHEYDKNNKLHKLKDKNKEEDLKKKLDQLLVWLVKGSIEYFKNGLGEPPEGIKKATDGYMVDNDSFQEFLDEYCELDNDYIKGNRVETNYSETLVDMFDLYKNHMKNKNIKRIIFTDLMESKNIKKVKKKYGCVYLGIKIKIVDNKTE